MSGTGQVPGSGVHGDAQPAVEDLCEGLVRTLGLSRASDVWSDVCDRTGLSGREEGPGVRDRLIGAVIKDADPAVAMVGCAQDLRVSASRWRPDGSGSDGG